MDRGVIPKGLRIQHESYYMDASVNNITRSNIENILKKSEREVCKAMIGHYKALEGKTRSWLELVERKINGCLNGNPSDVPSNFVFFQTKLESSENTLRNSLEKNWAQKLARLTPRPFHTKYAHTHHLQVHRRGGTQGYAPYRTPDVSRKGKGTTSRNVSSHTWKTPMPSSQSPLLDTPTASFCTPTGRWRRENSPSHNDELKEPWGM